MPPPPLSGYMLISYIAAAEREAGKPLDELGTTEALKTALDAFKESAPDLLFSLWSKHRVGQEQLRLVLLDVWRYTDRTAAWPARWCRSLFRKTGFVSDGLPCPRYPITVYRGTRPEGRRGLSWTLHEHQAESFADYWWDHGYRHPPGHVPRIRVGPKNILAIISGHNKIWTQ